MIFSTYPITVCTGNFSSNLTNSSTLKRETSNDKSSVTRSTRCIVLLYFKPEPLYVLPVADPVAGWGRVRNVKFMRPPSVAIFFITYFYRAGGGGHDPLGPPLDPLLVAIGISL